MGRVVWAVVAVAGLGVGAGCGRPAAPPAGPAPRDALEDIGRMLRILSDEGKKPPAGAAQLGPLDPLLPSAGPMIRDGTIVYLWGAGYSASGTGVVAYEKKVPAEGGLVLREDGTVKEMTADEFKSAPKAK